MNSKIDLTIDFMVYFDVFRLFLTEKMKAIYHRTYTHSTKNVHGIFIAILAFVGNGKIRLLKNE